MKSMTVLGMTQRTIPADFSQPFAGLTLPVKSAVTVYDWRVSVVGFGRNTSDAAETRTFTLRTVDAKEAREIIARESAEDLAAYRVGD